VKAADGQPRQRWKQSRGRKERPGAASCVQQASTPRFLSRWPARAAPGFPSGDFFEVARNDGLVWGLGGLAGAKTLADFTSVRPFFLIIFFLFPIRVPWASGSTRLWNGAGEDQAPHADRLPPRDRSVIMHWRSSARDRFACAVVRRARLATLRDCAPLGAAHLPREESQRSRTQTRDSSMMRCGTTTRLVNDEIRHPRVPRRRGWREGQETQPEILLLIDPSKSGLS
jgi:hypothetical protein